MLKKNMRKNQQQMKLCIDNIYKISLTFKIDDTKCTISNENYLLSCWDRI